MKQQFVLQELRHFNHSLIILSRRFPELAGINGYPRINIIVKRQDVVPENKIPCEGIKIIFFAGEFYFKIFSENVGHFIKSFQATIIVNDRFGAAEVGAESSAHTLRM